MFANNNHTNIHVRPILYYDDINPHSRAVLMLLNMLDVDVELRPIEMIKGEHLKPDYTNINAARTVPLLVHKDIVVSGNAIFSYVCENNDTEKAKQLLAIKCYKRHCRVLSRLFFESQVLHRIHGQLMTDLIRKTIVGTDVEFHSRKVESAYDTIEIYLKESPFVAGSVLTAADISFVACIGALDMMFPIAADAHRWEKLLDWFKRMRSLSVQKINVNGIEKERRIVEYFAKFSFKSDIKRYTTSVRSSLIPRLSLQPLRCSTASQTLPAISGNDDNVEPQSESSPLEPPTVNQVHPERQQNEVHPERQQNEVQSERQQNEVHPKMQQNLTEKVHELTNAGSFKTMHAAELLNDIMPLDELSTRALEDVARYPAPSIENELTSKATILKTDDEKTAQATNATESSAERSAGGAQREKPPVPPKRKRKTSIVLDENTQNSQPEETDEPNKVFIQNVLELSQRTPIVKPNIPPATEPRTDSLSRLDGGVGLAQQKKTQNKMKPIFVHAPQVVELLELNKAKTERTLTKKSSPPSADKKSKFNEKSAPLQISLLPPNLPINCPQVALQYYRGVNAPVTTLPAPPPTPENSSQDDTHEEEFPPPPSEMLLQNLRASGTNTGAASVVSSKTTTGTLPRKKSSNLKAEAQSAPRTIRKLATKKCDAKPGRKTNAAEEQKIWKKSSKGCLVASGTKSPSSNISQCSLLRNKPRIEVSTSTTKKQQDPKKAHVPKEKQSPKSLVTTEASSKDAEKKQRALGGGQKKSKQKAALGRDDSQAVPSLSVTGSKKSKVIVAQSKPFKISTSTPGDLEISVSTVVKKVDCKESETTSQKNPPQTKCTAANMSLETTEKLLGVKSNDFSSAIAAKDVNIEAHPTNVAAEHLGRNETEGTSAQTQRRSELMPQSVSTATNTSFEIAAKAFHAGQKPLNIVAENAEHKKAKEIMQLRPSSIVDNARTSASKNAQQGASTSSQGKPLIAATQAKKDPKTATQKLNPKPKTKVYPTKLLTRLQTKTSQESKTFDTSPYRPNMRPYRAQPRVEAARKGAIKTKTTKRGSKGSNNSLQTPARSVSPTKPELETASVLSSVQEIAGTEETSLVSEIETKAPATTPKPVQKRSQAEVQSPDHLMGYAANQAAPAPSSPHLMGHAANQAVPAPLSAVNTLTKVVQAQAPTADTSSTLSVQSASNCAEVNNSNVVADVLVTVGLVAQTLLTLNAVAKKSATTTPPQPPPLPPPLSPPPVVLPREPKRKPPPLPPPIPLLEDVLPTPGTVAKALQSLSANTKSLKKDISKLKNIEKPIRTEVKTTTQSGNTARTFGETNNARPLAEILTATVRQANRNKRDETEIKKGTQQSYKKSEKLTNKMGENVVPAAKQKMETNVEEELVEMSFSQQQQKEITKSPTNTDQPVEQQEPNQSAKATEVDATDFQKSVQVVNTTLKIVHSISDESNTFKLHDASTAPKLTVSGPQEPIALSTNVVDTDNVLLHKENESLSSISETHEPEISILSLAAGTHTTISSESTTTNPLAPPPTTKTVPPSRELYRKIIDMALLNEQRESMNPTTLAAKPNIFINGYTPVNAQPTAQTAFTGAGRTVGSRANATRLRALSKLNGSALHGPSANVVISTFGYTPMSESDSTIEPLLSGYTMPTMPTASLIPFNSKTYATTTTDSIQPQHAESVVQPTGRALSPRPREYRPYPTAHRSSSLSGGERRTTM